MLSSRRSVFPSAILAALLMAAPWATTGCSAGYSSSASQTLANGRVVSVESDVGSVNIPPPPSPVSALIEVGGRKILVDSEQVSIDGSKVATIAAEAKKVHITIDGAHVVILADRTEVLRGDW